MLKYYLVLFVLLFTSSFAHIPTREKPYSCGNEMRTNFPMSTWHIVKNSDNTITATGRKREYSVSTKYPRKYFHLVFLEGISWKDFSDDRDNGCFLFAIDNAGISNFVKKNIGGTPPEMCPIMKDRFGVYIENQWNNHRVYAIPSNDEKSLFLFHVGSESTYLKQKGFDAILRHVIHIDLPGY